MEQGFKIAIWMLCLIGYLQAKPVTRSPVKISDLNGVYLRKEVKCGNETFTRPTNVEESCRHAAVQHFIGQLVLAQDQKKCVDEHVRIGGTLQTLHQQVLPLVPNNTSTCQLETKTSQFEIFVNATEDFVRSVNAKLRQTGSGK